MTEGVVSVSIAATPEQVWPWVADLDKHSAWSPKPYSMEWISGEPNQVGSRYRSVGVIPGDKHHQNEGEITEREEGTRFGLLAHDKEGDYRSLFVLAEGPGGTTEVTHTLSFGTLHGMAKLLVPIAFPMIGKPDIRKRMQLLKGAVEGAS